MKLGAQVVMSTMSERQGEMATPEARSTGTTLKRTEKDLSYGATVKRNMKSRHRSSE